MSLIKILVLVAKMLLGMNRTLEMRRVQGVVLLGLVVLMSYMFRLRIWDTLPFLFQCSQLRQVYSGNRDPCAVNCGIVKEGCIPCTQIVIAVAPKLC